MMKKILAVAVVASTSQLTTEAIELSPYNQTELKIMQNLRTILRNPAKKALLEHFRADGTWSDIDYADRSRGSNWSPRLHLSRMFQLASGHPELALKALEAWLKRDPGSENWWWGCIGIPQNLCNTIIKIGVENIPADLLKKAEPLIRRSYLVAPWSGKKFTGQNLVWCEEIRLCTGLIYHAPALVQEGHDAILAELKIAETGKEGLQPDWTFHQHGTQNQIGNYGLSFLTTQLRWARAFQGTRFAYTQAQIELLDRYFSECLHWTLLDGIMDYNFCGRQLWNGAPENKCRIIMNAGKNLLQLLPPERQKGYKEWLKNPEILCGAKAYPCSGALIYRTPEWYFSLRMSSAELQGSETVNEENLQGRYQGDGLYFWGNMKRYKGFPALFNQRFLPGTTEVQDNSSLRCIGHNTKGYYAVLAAFPAAIAAMRLEAEDIQADKVWFCTTDGVYCAGSDIRSNADAPVITTVDQYTGKSWGIAEGNNIERKEEIRKDNWKNSFGEFPSEPIKGKIVTLTINHGIKPDGATYRYALKIQKKSNAQWLQTSSPRIHALATEGKILTAAFVAGTVKMPDGGKLKLQPGIAVWTSDGKMQQSSSFVQ